MKSNKKAFTIVELVIVIAVIAILAAVLIPTFSNMIKRSKVSADQQLIRNLNSALKADLKDHNTMTDALAAAAEFGYDVSKINKSATDNEILWDSKNDAFCYFESDKNDITYIPETTLTVPKDQVKPVDYWVIAKTPSDKYSTYLYNTELTEIENLKTGLDVGNETISSITYVGKGSAQSVTIRTTGGTLTVNAPDDEVTHYEFADVVSVINVATASYHENGTVKFLEVTAGHIVLEKDAKVTALHFTATGEEFENAQGKQISIDLSKIAKDNLPSFSRDAVTIATDGTFVAKVTSDSDEFIWLFGSGIKERMVVVSSNAAIAENGALKAGVTAGCETGSVAEQIANPAKRNAQGELVNNNNQVVSADDAVVGTPPSKEAVQTGATLFAGGTGSENDPYLISNRDEFENMSNISTYSYFKWVGESTVDASNWLNSNYLCGSFDGNNVNFYNLDNPLFNVVRNGSESGSPSEDTENTFTVKNLTVNANIVKDGWTSAVVGTAAVHNFVMDNVTVHGYIEGATGVASFICFGAGNYDPSLAYDGHITFQNCNSDAVIYAKSGNAVGFIAHAMMKSSAGTVTLENSNYTGSTSAPSANACKYICGNHFNGTVTDDQSSSKNNVIYTSSDNGWTYKAEGKTGSFTVKNGSLPSNIGASFVEVAESSATRATVSLVISPDPGCMTSTYLTEEVLVSNGTVTSENVKYFIIRVNASGVSEAGAHGNNFDILNNSFNGKLGGNTIVRITQYNAAGAILSITNYNFNDKSN